MTKECLNEDCRKPIVQAPGKRSRLYCDGKCKARYFQKVKADKMISISREEYQRLLACEFELKVTNLLDKQGETKVSLVPEGIKISTTTPESYDSNKVNRAFSDEFGQWEDNTKVKKIKAAVTDDFKPVLAPIIEKQGKRTGEKKESEIKVAESFTEDNIHSLAPKVHKSTSLGLTKAELAKWRKNNK